MSKSLLTTYDELFTQKTGARYPVNGKKDGQLLKNLRSIYSDEDIARFMQAYFEMDDEFFEKTGWSLGCFFSCLPRIIAFANQVQRPKLSKTTAGNVASIQDFLRGGG